MTDDFSAIYDTLYDDVTIQNTIIQRGDRIFTIIEHALDEFNSECKCKVCEQLEKTSFTVTTLSPKSDDSDNKLWEACMFNSSIADE